MTSAKETLDALTERARGPAPPTGAAAEDELHTCGPLPAFGPVLAGYGRYLGLAALFAAMAYFLAMYVVVGGIGELSDNASTVVRDLALALLGVDAGLLGGWLLAIVASFGVAYLVERASARAWPGALVLPLLWLVLWWLAAPSWFALLEHSAFGLYDARHLELVLVNIPTPLWALGPFFGLAWLSARYPHWALRWLTFAFATYFAVTLGMARHAEWTAGLIDRLYVFATYDPIAANNPAVYQALERSGWCIYLRSVSDWLLLMGVPTLLRSQAERLLHARHYAHSTRRAAAMLPNPTESHP